MRYLAIALAAFLIMGCATTAVKDFYLKTDQGELSVGEYSSTEPADVKEFFIDLIKEALGKDDSC